MSRDAAQYLEALHKELRRDMNNLADELANGRPQDYAAYREVVGKIHGLADAEEHLKELLKRAQGIEADEEDMS